MAKIFQPVNAPGRMEREAKSFLPAIRIDSVASMKQAVLGSGAISWAPWPLIRMEVEQGLLQTIPFDPPWASLKYGFLTLRKRVLPVAALAFMAEVRRIECEVVNEQRKFAEPHQHPKFSEKRDSERRRVIPRAKYLQILEKKSGPYELSFASQDFDKGRAR
jgi:hypothetical protein